MQGCCLLMSKWQRGMELLWEGVWPTETAHIKVVWHHQGLVMLVEVRHAVTS